MGQQHRKETKRRRRTAYIKRQKEIAKNTKNLAPVQLARKVVKEDTPADPSPEKEVKKPAAKKAPAKKPTVEKAADKEEA
ncbi:MAG: hypothetical protein Q3986_05025 [Akkermansia sp.]|nr:hypothetical protein [Akkermansia sp.]